MAIKAISQFDAAIPTSNDKILFEQNGEGKSTALADLPIPTKTQTALNAKVSTANVLSLEEIQATTDLTGKVASASALKDLNSRGVYKIYMADTSDTLEAVFPRVAIGYRLSGFLVANLNGGPFFTNVILFSDGKGTNGSRGDGGAITVTDNGDNTARVTVGGLQNWSKVNLIVLYT